MSSWFYLLLLGVMAYSLYKNMDVFKRSKHNKEYIELYKEAIGDPENAADKIQDYLNREDSVEFINKAKILQLYVNLHNGTAYEDILSSLDLKTLFFTKNKFDAQLTSYNSDSFIWIILLMAKAHASGKNEVIEEIYHKISIEEINNYLEYQEVKATYDLFMNNANNFFNDLIEGNYRQYQYDKNLIGLFKRLAAASLAYQDKLNDDYYEEDLKHFVTTLVGKSYTKDLGIYDKYLTVTQDDDSKQKEEV